MCTDKNLEGTVISRTFPSKKYKLFMVWLPASTVNLAKQILFSAVLIVWLCAISDYQTVEVIIRNWNKVKKLDCVSPEETSRREREQLCKIWAFLIILFCQETCVAFGVLGHKQLLGFHVPASSSVEIPFPASWWYDKFYCVRTLHGIAL